jgi:thymidylate synthase ThyX
MDIRIVADSINWTDYRLTTIVFSIPTCLLAELRTHRLLLWSEDSEFSVNANSDRAIPVETKIKSVIANPYIPIASLANKGMSGIEQVSMEKQELANEIWQELLNNAIATAKELLNIGMSKQYINRVLMPYSWSDVVVTGDNIAWNSFFKLRTKDDVEPNFRIIAKAIKEAYEKSEPKYLEQGEYHIAFKEEVNSYSDSSLMEKLMISGSCSARISYSIEREETLEKHKKRFINCIKSGHSSIAEHQARVPTLNEFYDKQKIFKSNVKGWILLRRLIETERISITSEHLVEGWEHEG